MEEYVTIRVRRDRLGRKAKPRPSVDELTRLYRDLTQAELAQHYRVSTATIGRWLRDMGVYKYGKDNIR